MEKKLKKSDQITKNAAYEAVAPDDFASMIEVDRYEQRSSDFDKIISDTHAHFWDPLDTKYIDFSENFDVENKLLMPEEFLPELQCPSVMKLDKKSKIKLANESFRWQMSAILHGEQGALNLSASLCHILKDQGAQEYAANQAREEARHVTGFAKYINSRWGKPLPVGQTLGDLLSELVNAPEVYKKIVGMQILVEGLAMGAFATIYQHSYDPVLVKLMQLVMTDEAFHHKFGKIWADKTIPQLDENEQNIIEDWAANCFQILLFNLVNPEQKKIIYDQFGLDWRQVLDELHEIITDDDRRERMRESTDIFRVLVKTLFKAGIITDRTKDFYSVYVNLDELKEEGDRMVGDDIADEGLQFLKEINFKDNTSRSIAAE
ncbi:MAG: ferritin-like domain-containing protein [Alphaproteobacteria bacterium]